VPRSERPILDAGPRCASHLNTRIDHAGEIHSAAAQQKHDWNQDGGFDKTGSGPIIPKAVKTESLLHIVPLPEAYPRARFAAIDRMNCFDKTEVLLL
jgi:hypothetical protein